MAQVINWEEKIKKAEEAARKKAEKDGLDEAATQKAVEDAVAKVKEAQKKAEEAATKAKVYLVTVKNNPNFVGTGAGGVQFANGEAKVNSERMANWFREHPGYDVKEIAE